MIFQGFFLMLIGMSSVLMFLILLILLINFIARFFKEEAQNLSFSSQKDRSNLTVSKIPIGLISAAVAAYEEDRRFL